MEVVATAAGRAVGVKVVGVMAVATVGVGKAVVMAAGSEEVEMVAAKVGG